MARSTVAGVDRGAPRGAAARRVGLALAVLLAGGARAAAPDDPSRSADDGPPAATAPGPGRVARLTDALAAVPADLKALLRYPLDHGAATRDGLLAVGALVLVDRPTTQFWQQHVETALDGFHLPASPLNRLTRLHVGVEDGWMLTGVAGTALWGLVADDGRAEVTAVRATEAAAYSVLVSQLVLKSLTGRLRPSPDLASGTAPAGDTTNPYDFGHLHAPVWGSGGSGSGMPSYHFTVFFAVAGVYSRAYGNAWWPYGLAALGLASNVRGHHHWVSDMTAGALVGTAIAGVVSRDRPESRGGLRWAPELLPGGAGVQVRMAF